MLIFNCRILEGYINSNIQSWPRWARVCWMGDCLLCFLINANLFTANGSPNNTSFSPLKLITREYPCRICIIKKFNAQSLSACCRRHRLSAARATTHSLYGSSLSNTFIFYALSSTRHYRGLPPPTPVHQCCCCCCWGWIWIGAGPAATSDCDSNEETFLDHLFLSAQPKLRLRHDNSFAVEPQIM